MRARKRYRLLVLLAGIGLAVGCGRTPQLQPGNRKLLEALRTAVSAKNSQWLASTSKAVEEKRAKNEISDVEFQALHGVIQKANASDWKGAQKEVFTLVEGQRPTVADRDPSRPTKPRRP